MNKEGTGQERKEIKAEREGAKNYEIVWGSCTVASALPGALSHTAFLFHLGCECFPSHRVNAAEILRQSALLRHSRPWSREANVEKNRLDWGLRVSHDNLSITPVRSQPSTTSCLANEHWVTKHWLSVIRLAHSPAKANTGYRMYCPDWKKGSWGI